MKVRHSDDKAQKIELQMTPMIDIVFQLLVFFIMTFKIVLSEGDFDMRLPKGQREGPPPDHEIPPVSIVLKASSSGRLMEIIVGGETCGRSFTKLNDKMFEIGKRYNFDYSPAGVLKGTEVELNCDPDLQYQYVIQAITAVSGRVEKNGNVIKLFEKVKFSPRKRRS